MITKGFVHIDREKFLNSPIWNKPNHYFKIFMYLLLTANFADDDYLKRGQAIADLDTLANMCSSGTGKATERHTAENIYHAIKHFCSKTSGMQNEYKTISKNKVLVTLSEYDKITNSSILGNPVETETNPERKQSTIIYNNNNKKQITSRAASSVKVKSTTFSNFEARGRDFDEIKKKAKEKLRREKNEQ